MLLVAVAYALLWGLPLEIAVSVNATVRRVLVHLLRGAAAPAERPAKARNLSGVGPPVAAA